MSPGEFWRCLNIITIFGCILLSTGTAILFWNEGRSVKYIVSLDEALDNAVTIDPTRELENNYNGRLVHIAGPLIVGEPLTEPDYNIDVMAVKLRRRVQMYQWVEEMVEGAGTEDTRSYYYTMEWRDHLIDSRAFYLPTGHRNPERFPIESATQMADAVFIGNYELSSPLKDRIERFVEMTSDTRPEDPSIKMHSGLYYHTNDIFNPEIGDLRILFSFAGLEGDMYTVTGKLDNRKIVPYTSSRDINLILVHPGELTLTDTFKNEHYKQRLTAWQFRFMGWVLIFFGITCNSVLLHSMLINLPFLSALAPDRQSPVVGNLILSLSLACIIASIAWVLYRPVVGACLMFAAASPFVWCARGITGYSRVN